MADTVVIDIVARFNNQAGQGVNSASNDVERLNKKLKDTKESGEKADGALKKITQSAANLARKAITLPIRVIDYATKPIRGLLNYALSLKGILTGLVMGQMGNKLIGNPLGLADQYSNAFLGFETLFKSEEKAQQMMNDLDEFARTTPFKTSNVIGQSQKMLAMGWDAGDLIKDMTIIGDASAALGKGDEGLQRIVLALAQIKSKGKLSTEELNQLAEAGVNAKSYISEGLGYGADDAAKAKMAKQLEGGKIGGNAAVAMILAGMERDYSGMMAKTAAETVEGIKSNIEDTFEINIFRKWGQGLQEGAKRGLGSLADLLDESQDKLSGVGDQLQELGAFLSNKFANSIEFATDKTMKLTNSTEFKETSFGGKIKILWDGVIADPFRQWWSSKGQAWAAEAAGKIGGGIGSAFKGGILALLGVDSTGAVDSGLSIGKNFAEGFLDGFDGETVGKAIWDALGRAFKSAGKLLPGGEAPDTASYLSAGLLGYGAFKIGGKLAPVVGGAKSLMGSLTGDQAMALRAVNMGAGNLPGGASMSAGALSMLGAAGTAGFAVGGLSLFSAMNDWARAAKSIDEKEQNVYRWSAGAKVGMTGGGAALGAALGSVIPGLGTLAGAGIGAGVGGLASLFAGNKIGRSISDWLDGEGKRKEAVSDIKKYNDELRKSQEFTGKTEGLVKQYEELAKLIDSGKLTPDETVSALEEQKRLVQELEQLYPDLITQHDIELGRLGDKLDIIKRMTDKERERAKLKAEQAIAEGKEVLPDIVQKMEKSGGKVEELTAKKDRAQEAARGAEEIESRVWTLEQEYQYKRDINGKLSAKDAREYEYKKAQIQKDIDAFNEEYNPYDSHLGYNYFNRAKTKRTASVDYNKDYKKYLDDLVKAAEKSDENLAEYRGVYDSFIEHALLNSDVNIKDIQTKIAELENLGAKTQELTAKLNDPGADKNSEEYKAAEKELESTKKRQAELTEEIEKSKVPLHDIVQKIMEINREFDKLPEEHRFDITIAAKYLGFNQPEKAMSGGVSSAYSAADALRKYLDPLQAGKQPVGAYAKGTVSAPTGMAWVGEEGPELVQFKGGERVYTATESKSIFRKFTNTNTTAETKNIFQKIGGIVGAYAKGTGSAPPGAAWTGEEGPELVQFKGSDTPRRGLSQRIAASVETYRQNRRSADQGRAGGPAETAINLGGIQVTVNAQGGPEGVAEALRDEMPKVANEVSRIIATQLSKIYANMPRRIEGV